MLHVRAGNPGFDQRAARGGLLLRDGAMWGRRDSMKPLPAFALGALAAIVVAGLVGFAVVVSGIIPANADAKPSDLERWAAQTSLRATVRRQMPTGAVPLAVTPANLLAGLQLYRQNCIACHGTSQARATNVARGLYVRPPRFGRPHALERDPPGEIYWKIEHGIRWTAMPSFGSSLRDEQIWQLTLFLKNLHSLPPQVAQAWRSLDARTTHIDPTSTR
jgi:thiosulfate dehydrogenase